MRNPRDKELGMNRDITRRDFLNGVALTVGAAIVPSPLMAAYQGKSDDYPPARTGLRGSHAGSFEALHSVRDGTFWESAGKPIDTAETYDLVIVGGGISGLSAAHFFRKLAGAKARILILENHDDFGGHAKRNEFRVNSHSLLGYGGTYSIESPAPYSPVAKSVISELGIDVASYPKYVAKDLYRSMGLAPNIFFDKETFGADKLIVNPAPLGGGENADLPGRDPQSWKQFLAEAPLSDRAKRDYDRLYHETKDYLPGLSSDEKKAKLARMSYARFLTDLVGVNEEVIKVLQAGPQPLFGVGIDAMAAQDAWGLNYPGFRGMNLDPKPGPGMNRDAIPNEEAEKYFFHFPDGNASIARLLVRQLIPGVIPGNSAMDVVTRPRRLLQTRPPVLPGSHPVEQYGGAHQTSRRPHDRRAGGSHLCDGWEGVYGSRVRLHSCLLACGNSLHLRRVAGKAEGRACRRSQSAVALYQRCFAQLEIVPEARGQFRLRSRGIPLAL